MEPAAGRASARPLRHRLRGCHFRVHFVRFQGVAAPCQTVFFLPQFHIVKLQAVPFADPCRNAVATFILRASPPRIGAAGVLS
jgi:hypothetical protein